MNKIEEILDNLSINKNAELFNDSIELFKANFKRLSYMVEYTNPQFAFKLNDFVDAIPEHILDVSCDENFLSRMFANGEVFENGKIAEVESVNNKEEDLKFVLMFNKSGNLIRLEIKTPSKSLILIGDEKSYDLAILEFNTSKPTCFKLVKTLKDCYSLTKGTNADDVAETVLSLDPKVIDQKIKGINNMVARWNEISQ